MRVNALVVPTATTPTAFLSAGSVARNAPQRGLQGPSAFMAPALKTSVAMGRGFSTAPLSMRNSDFGSSKIGSLRPGFSNAGVSGREASRLSALNAVNLPEAFDDEHINAQLQVLFDELNTEAGWGVEVDDAGVETISGKMTWVKQQQSGRFETETATLTQPCNPVMALIADEYEIPFPVGYGETDFSLSLSKFTDGKILPQASLM